MPITSVAVKLEDEIKERIQHLGELKDRSSHWLMKRAILDYLEKEEQYEQEKLEDEKRWEAYTQTGEAVSHNDMKKLAKVALDYMPNKELIWLPEAKDDIARLHEFLKSKNPDAASRMVDLLLQGADMLLDFPEIGKPLSDELKRRELFLAFGAGAYVLRYILTEDNIAVIRVWHSREMR